MEQSERLKQLLLDIDAQIKAERARRPPGDRRRVHQGPPQGMDERRAQPDRRGRARAQQGTPTKNEPTTQRTSA